MARSLCAVFAHPDDETFSIGGSLARYSAEGVACHLYVATDGNAGKTSAVRVSGPAELGLVRRQELHEAARVLGVASVRAAGHPDGALGAMPEDALLAEVVDFLREHRPEVVVTFGPEGAPNGHADHKVIYGVATRAFDLAARADAFPEQLGAGRAPHAARRLYYVTFGPFPEGSRARVRQGLPVTARLDARPWLPAKRQAFEAHRSQHVHREVFETLSLVAAEDYALGAGEPQPAPMIDDLFAGMGRRAGD